MANSEFYKKSGVDTDKAGQFVQQIKPLVQKTFRKEVLSSIGAFAGFFQIDWSQYHSPVLLSATDGVGTKLIVSQKANNFETIGIDLVAMCVNDIIVHGGEPLFFLDYISIGHLDTEITYKILEGITEGCLQAECSLIGGETAEMPSLYKKGHFDLAGFCVGIVEKNKIIEGHSIAEGDILLGLPSSGLHSNGYSLVRKIIFEEKGMNTETILFNNISVEEELLRPTKIYVQQIKHLLKTCHIKGMAHITGGGFDENIPRILPPSLTFELKTNSWPLLSIFDWIQKETKMSWNEMYQIFNCGIGMVLILSQKEGNKAQELLKSIGEESYMIGEIRHS